MPVYLSPPESGKKIPRIPVKLKKRLLKKVYSDPLVTCEPLEETNSGQTKTSFITVVHVKNMNT